VDFDSAAVENIGDIMSVEALISTQVIDTTSVGRSIMTAADAAAVRTAADAQVTLVSGANIKTINSTSLLGSGDIAVGVSGTGAVDNAVLRADGTGGATLQSSAFVIADNATASPNNTVNHASLQATGGTTNVSVSIVPKGAGAFCLQVPDGTATGGNARGNYAVDLQTTRGTAAKVASGVASFAVGSGNTASGTYSFAQGSDCIASAQNGFAVGFQCTAAGNYTTFAFGEYCSATADNAIAMGFGALASANHAMAFGRSANATRHAQYSHSAGAFAATGDAQYVRFIARRKTTDATPVTLILDGSSLRLTITSGKVMSVMCRICGIKSDGSAVANYVRRVVIKNVGGTTSLVGSVETIGTDIEDNASTDVAITADNTNDALQIDVTGIAAETWRWVAVVEGLEIAYGA
jgi:hypothetical protein